MRSENLKMKAYLAENGIKAVPKLIRRGSMRGLWRLINHKAKNFSDGTLYRPFTKESINKLQSLNFHSEDWENSLVLFVSHPQKTLEFTK